MLLWSRRRSMGESAAAALVIFTTWLTPAPAAAAITLSSWVGTPTGGTAALFADLDDRVALFADLDDRVSWTAGLLQLDYRHLGTDEPVAGRGLALTPSVFIRAANMQIDPMLPPAIAYPARGLATLTDPPTPAAPALQALLGKTRALLLLDLAGPASTTQLARRHAFTPSSVNQHLTVLHTSGLVDRARAGRSVHYRRTQLDNDLITG